MSEQQLPTHEKVQQLENALESIDFEEREFSVYAQKRIREYKTRGSKTEQEKRRKKLLNEQKEKRDQALKEARILEMVEQDTDNDTDTPSDVDKRKKTKKKKRIINHNPLRYKEKLMIPENMFEIPEDLKEKWYSVPLPLGKRCLVISCNGTTRSYLRNGTLLHRFYSDLPGGYFQNRSERGAGGGNRATFCVLDCIFYEPSLTYFVLDIISWKGFAVWDCNAEFRFYWRNTKISEDCPNISKLNVTNEELRRDNYFRIIPIPYFDCTEAGISSALKVGKPNSLHGESLSSDSKSGFNNPNSSITLKPSLLSHHFDPSQKPPELPQETQDPNSFRREGMLFYHKDGNYTIGVTPIVVGLPDDMISMVLSEYLENDNSMKS